jgi:alanine racemase
MTDVEGRPTIAEVSLGALRENCRQARRLVGERVAVMAVVKANGYGHGAAMAARAFVEAGATSLGVSSVEEGFELRRDGIDAPIVVLGGAFDGEEATAVAHDFALALWTADRARRIAAAAERAGRVVAVHLKLDTGMTRLGLDVDDVTAFAGLLATLPYLSIAGVFSHLASADSVDSSSAKTQIARFRSAVDALAAAGVRPAHVHLANSAAVLAAPEAHFTLVRPGLMLYGYAPAPHLLGNVGLRPAMRLVSRLAQVRRIPAGRAVGYGGTWVSARPSVIGTVPVGYADGYHRMASNRAQVVLHGRRAPIAGRVCMDHTMVDVTEVDGAAERDRVLLFGTHGQARLGADELASWTDTIPYEVLTSVGRRVRRVYVEEFGA